MLSVRRTLQIVALVGTLMVGAIALALIVSQTPWFRDWLRRYIVREVEAVPERRAGDRRAGRQPVFRRGAVRRRARRLGPAVVAIKTLEVDYSVFRSVVEGHRHRRDQAGRRRASCSSATRRRLESRPPGEEAGAGSGPQGARASRSSLPSIEITDGAVVDRRPRRSARYSCRGGSTVSTSRAAFEYAPVHYSLSDRRPPVSRRRHQTSRCSSSPAGWRCATTTSISRRSRSARTRARSRVDGVIKHYLQTPVLKLTATANASLPRDRRVVRRRSRLRAEPAFDVKANGPVDRLGARPRRARPKRATCSGQVTADCEAPDIGAKRRRRRSKT